mmetsp:Transcript_57787/g.135109  ORF Transcript_57787/g.135109 Transcript_57787/m.135109 type:complete len:204 (-) Transcript_57787:334-945(-)|eukprot:1980877-Amphidinium_carterae.1
MQTGMMHTTDLEILSLAGSRLAALTADLTWTVEKLQEHVMSELHCTCGHVKLVHSGNILEADQTLARALSQDGDMLEQPTLIYAVQMAGPRPGRYAGSRWKSDEDSFLNVRWELRVMEDGVFALESSVSCNVPWADRDVCVTGKVVDAGRLVIDDCFTDEEISMDVRSPTKVCLSVPLADLDGGYERQEVALKWQGSATTPVF